MEPLTQRLSVSWSRSITYYEARWRILRRLEDTKLLYQFRVENDVVHARLGDAHHLLSFSADGLQLNLLQGDGDLGRVLGAAEIVWDEITPKLLLDGGCSFQWLEALDEEYETAKATMTRSLIAGELPGVRSADPAFLLVGDLGEPSLHFALECGIVNPSEVPSRLARELGQLTHLAHPDVPNTLWASAVFPEVAFFCDSDWQSDYFRGRQTPAVADIRKTWAATREAAGRVVFAMMNRAKGEPSA